MRGVIVFFAIIFITLLVGVIVLYFYFEKPAQEEYNKYANVINFSIYATENGQYVQTNYEIKVDDILYSTGVTLLESPIMESIHTNSSVIIYNKNRETQ